jgi:hypothetical protein
MVRRWIVSVVLAGLFLGGLLGCSGSDSSHKNVKTISSDRFPNRGGGGARQGGGPRPGGP